MATVRTLLFTLRFSRHHCPRAVVSDRKHRQMIRTTEPRGATDDGRAVNRPLKAVLPCPKNTQERFDGHIMANGYGAFHGDG